MKFKKKPYHVKITHEILPGITTIAIHDFKTKRKALKFIKNTLKQDGQIELHRKNIK